MIRATSFLLSLTVTSASLLGINNPILAQQPPSCTRR